MACGRREPPRLVNLHNFVLVASLLNSLPKCKPLKRNNMGQKVLVLFSDIKEQFESSKQSQWSLMFVFLSITQITWKQ